MITETAAKKRVVELQEQIAQIEKDLVPQIMALSDLIIEEEDDDKRAELQAKQDELGSTTGADYLHGRLDELVALFDLDDLVSDGEVES